MAFFERFRVELRKYAAGVHELGEPASLHALESAELRLGRALPAALKQLYQSWNGMRLFVDTVVIEPLTGVAVSNEGARGLRLGEWPDGILFLDDDGRVWSRDGEGDRAMVGSTLERFLAALMAREALLIDREGEFKDVFEDGEIQLAVRQKRTRAALKADPDAAAWQREAAELAFEVGNDAEAEAALERALELDGDDAEGWQLFGSLKRRAGCAADAVDCFAHACAATPTTDASARAERAAEAARAAAEAGDEPARGRYADVALSASPDAPARYLEDARRRLEEGDADGALNLASLAAALVPEGDAVDLVKQARVRAKLRTLH